VIELPPPYRPAQIPFADWPVVGEDRPANYPIYEEREHFLATIHGFDAGGFEATVRYIDLQAMVDARLHVHRRRKQVEERSEKDMLRAVARAKKVVRHAVKQITCDHMMTLTTRQEENTPEELAVMWKAFVRRYRRFSNDEFPYVAVPERHPSNPRHWHLHVAIRGRLKLNIARQIWWYVCGGRGLGNVDVQWIKVGCDANGVPRGPLVKAEKIARYISKYMTKDLLFAHRPDKKRYWRSEFDMPEARRYWLHARPGENGVTDALLEFRERFRVSWSKCSFFLFPDGSGFWVSYNPDAGTAGLDERPPPF
jgi:hypothetical protein